MSTDSRYAEYRQQIAALPQAGVLKNHDIDRWLEDMFARVDALTSTAPAAHKDQSPTTDIGWHIRRAGGIGGSEAGVALLHERKEYWMDVSLPKLVDQKLFKALPDEANHHMERGTYLEPVAQRMCHTRYGATTDHAARAALASFPGWPAHPWLQGNDDDIVLIGDQRFLVDYKMPNEPMEDVALIYKAQLHHYWTLGHLAGIKFDGLLVAAATIPGAEAWVDAIKHDPAALDAALSMGEALARSDSPSAPVRLFRVDFSLDFAKELIRANHKVWTENVLTGKRPRFFRRERVALSDAEQATGDAIAQRIARRKAIIDYAEASIKDDNAQLRELLKDKEVSNKKQPFAVLSVGERKNLNLTAASEALIGQGVDADALRGDGLLNVEHLAKAAQAADVDIEQCREPGKWDSKKVLAALKKTDLDESEFGDATVTIGLSRARKGAGFEQTREIREAAAMEVDLFVFGEISLSDPAARGLRHADEAAAESESAAPATPDATPDATPEPIAGSDSESAQTPAPQTQLTLS